MKKLLFYALAAFTVMGASCSKDVEGLDAPTAEGKYTLPAITASLDDAETRTGFGTNNVVNWSNNDKIAIINTKTGVKRIYVLATGAGTPVGKFEPVNNAATFDAVDDIKAVYPAIAASVSTTAPYKISVSLNKEYTEEERAAVGITSWTANSSAYAFSNNDIKVSYKTSADFTSGSSSIPVNFKFRQLGTWCSFVFNFTANETFAMETMESFKITTTAGTKKISGTAEIDFTDPNQPTLKSGTEAAVEWTTTGSLNSASLTKQLMLFPALDGTNDQLKVEVKTALHTFTFYATPSALAAGTTLRFPFNVDDTFSEAKTGEDFTYSVVTNGDIPEFIYYGKANCLLLAGKTSGTLDIQAYKTNPYYWVMGDSEKVSDTNKKATYAEVIWRESTLTAITVAVSGTNLNVSGVAGTGNALVGIYDNSSASKKLLWSYHIWVPEIDPSADANILTYKYTNSGTYEVMPIALGATNKTTVVFNGTATDATNAKAMGLYYQWGRKDPLGRPNAITAGGEALVTTYAGATGSTAFALNTAETNLSTLLGGDAVTTKDGKDVDDYMIDYVTAHPTEFIVVPDGKYGNDWAGKTNDYLWGNPQGYNYPRKANLHRSIFDPCPAGYRVAPKDLWIAFTKTGNNFTANASAEDNWAENNFNIANRENGTSNWPTNKANTSMQTQRGYFFHYETNENDTKKWQTGATDFYPASGFRDLASGSLSSVGSGGWYWSSSPASAGSSRAGSLSFYSGYVSPLSSNFRAHGFPVRCVRE